MRHNKVIQWLGIAMLIAFFAMPNLPQASAQLDEVQKIRVGHFPNVTHAPALIARAKRFFEERFGGKVSIEWKSFNAGPEAIEALYASAIDILYVGPNPAINGYARSAGDALRVVAGVSSGGSGFVVREGAGIERFEDIRGKRVASPQKGNSQDVALHHLMREKGLRSRAEGGDVEIFHLSGGDQITALVKEQVDAIWTVEPWLSRLTAEAKAKVLFEESELWPAGTYATTVLVARRKFIEEYPDLVRQWVQGHIEMIGWIKGNFLEAKRVFNEEFERETGKALPLVYIEQSFARVQFTYDPMEFSVKESAERAYAIGYLGSRKPDLNHLYDLTFLESYPQKESS